MTTVKVAYITTVGMSLRFLLLNQLKDLQAAGYQVVGISSPDEDAAAIAAAGIRHIPVKMTRSLSPLADLVALWHLYRVFRRERFTIVHTHTPKPGLLGQLAARLAGVPIVVNTIHGFYFHERTPPFWRHFYIMLERIAARCSTLIFSVNQEDIQTAIHARIAPAHKLKLLGPGGIGIDLKRFDRQRLDPQVIARKRAELGLPMEAPVVGFVGRLVAEKGIIELMQAMQIVVQRVPHARLLMIGPIDSAKPDALTPAIAQEYGLAEACIFTGMRHDMPELYAMMDLFVLPSHREGFPVSPMEASAMEVPCIVTNIRGCREAVKHGVNGLLVQLGDVRALAHAIISVLTDHDLRQRLSAGARRMAEERFDEQHVFAHVRSTYAHLLHQAGRQAPIEPSPSGNLRSDRA